MLVAPLTSSVSDSSRVRGALKWVKTAVSSTETVVIVHLRKRYQRDVATKSGEVVI
jgi:hypothetical protein